MNGNREYGDSTQTHSHVVTTTQGTKFIVGSVFGVVWYGFCGYSAF